MALKSRRFARHTAHLNLTRFRVSIRIFKATDLICLQDVYKRLSSPAALQGMLRIRTSPEFKVSRAYGQLFQDEQYDNLVHITACRPDSTFAFDFQYTTAAGFATTADAPPMVQMVFQYSMLVPTLLGDPMVEHYQPRYVVLCHTAGSTSPCCVVMALHCQRPSP